MRWIPGDSYHIASEPYEWTICWVFTGKGWIVELWRKKERVADIRIGSLNDLDRAQWHLKQRAEQSQDTPSTTRATG